MLRMIDLGVDAIMTDQPLLLEALLSTPRNERHCDWQFLGRFPAPRPARII